MSNRWKCVSLFALLILGSVTFLAAQSTIKRETVKWNFVNGAQINGVDIDPSGGGGGAPTDAQYWTGAANGTLSAEKNLGGLSTGLVLNTSGTPTAYAGTSCAAGTAVGALNASGAATCASTGLVLDTQTASFTAVVGKLHRVNMASASAHVVVTFPTSPTTGDQFGVMVGTANTTDTGTSGYAVAPFWGVEMNNPTINSAAYTKSSGSGTGPLGLWLSGEGLVFEYVDGTVGWIILYDFRQKHISKAYNSAGQSITHNAAPAAVDLDNYEIDNAGLRDLTNNVLLPKRRGVYRIVAGWKSNANDSADGDINGVSVNVNSTLTINNSTVVGRASVRGFALLSDITALTEALAVQMTVNINRGTGSTAITTGNAVWSRAQISMVEE